MEIVNYKNYGKCVKFERNGLIAMVTVELGPRVIYYGTQDFNFMREDLERKTQKGGEYFDKEFKPGEKWFLYGGHRVWKSPEDMETYTTDNYPVEYAVDGDGFGGKFICKTAKRFLYSLTVKMDERGGLNVENCVQNVSKDRIKYAIWALSVMTKGGTLRVPLNEKVDDLNPSQNLVQWPYNDLKDERVDFTQDTLTVRQTDKVEALKLGLLSKKGRAYYTVGDKTLRWTVAPADYDAHYGDFGCNFETYTNENILEVEWLGPLAEHGNEPVILTEKFEIIDTPEFFA